MLLYIPNSKHKINFYMTSDFIMENNFDYLESKILGAWVGGDFEFSNRKFEKW